MARKQEQEDARTDVSEIAPNVLRMELPISMPGLGHVNCYALIDSEGAAVIDPGLPGPDTQEALRHRLAQAGLRETDVHTVLITHSHPDHFGSAKWLVKSGAKRIVGYKSFGWGIGLAPEGHHDHEVSVDDLRAHRDVVSTGEEFGGDSEEGLDQGPEKATEHAHPPHSMMDRWRKRRGSPSPWGGSPLGPSLRDGKESKVAELMMKEDFFPEISDPVSDGDRLRLAGREWFVRYTPGHTSDHICLHSPELGLFLSGDHVLPTITPHISGTSSFDDPLDRFIESLDDVAATESVELVLPAHGHPFEDLAGRTQEIKGHHRERLEELKKVGRELGAVSVVEYSKRLFPERSWGMMAESETYAHLEHLRHAREAECYRDDGKLMYRMR